MGGSDIDIVRNFWGQTVTPGDLSMGDASGDGFVGGDDLDIVRGNWGRGTPPAPEGAGSSSDTKASTQPSSSIAWLWHHLQQQGSDGDDSSDQTIDLLGQVESPVDYLS